MNGIVWEIIYVNPNDKRLIDRTGSIRMATTDPKINQICLSNILNYFDASFLLTVLIHELSHCALFSFDMLDDIHQMVKPEYWIEAEEWVCNFIADYGLIIYKIAYDIFGYNAWHCIPMELNKQII